MENAPNHKIWQIQVNNTNCSERIRQTGSLGPFDSIYKCHTVRRACLLCKEWQHIAIGATILKVRTCEICQHRILSTAQI